MSEKMDGVQTAAGSITGSTTWQKETGQNHRAQSQKTYAVNAGRSSGAARIVNIVHENVILSHLISIARKVRNDRI